MKKSRRTYNGVHLNKKSNTQDVVEQSLTIYQCMSLFIFVIPGFKQVNNKNRPVGILLFAKINLSK